MTNIEGKPCDCAGVSQSAEGIDCSEVPVGKGSRTVDIKMSGKLFDMLTTVAKVKCQTLGRVVIDAVGNYIKRCQQDPGFLQEVEDLVARLDKYNPNPNPRENE